PERRALLRALRDDVRFVAEHGRRPGVVLTGIGGVGKSSLAGQVATRLVEEGWVLVVRRGPFRLDDLAAALAEGLRTRAARLPASGGEAARTLEKRAAELGESASDEDLILLVGDTLRGWRVLVVLDDFEQNLFEGGERFTDDAVAQQLGILVEAAGRSKLLVTCRHPVPGFRTSLHEFPLGPLTGAETRKLVLRLPGLLRQPDAERDRVLRAVGGHPRVLELADALLRQGRGRAPVLGKLDDLARREGLPLRRGRDTRAATAEAVRLAEADVFLPQLLALLGPSERALLYQAAPSSLPIGAADLAVLTEGAEAETLEACWRLADLTLFSQAGEDAWLVERWLAEALCGRDPDRYREGCRPLAMRRLQLAGSDPTYDHEIEALRNLVTAQAWDDASQLVLGLCRGPFARSQLAVSALAGEVLRDLPPDHGDFGAVADLEGQADLACGLTDKAIKTYGKLLKIFRSRADAEPDRADYQRDLSVSYNKLGDLMIAVGRGDEAARLYQQSLDIFRRLADAEPDRADYQRDLSISYNRLGALAAEQGDPGAARDYLSQALAIARRLATQDPSSAALAVDVALSLVQLARLDPGNQTVLFDEARVILEPLEREGPLDPDAAALLDQVRGRPRE
ncbi:MAG: AAA family ATPase, partial [Egibacteraceae bacterium]